MKNQAALIKSFILKRISKYPHNIVSVAAEHFKVTRTTIHRHLNNLVMEKKIIKSGVTNNIKYYLSAALDRAFTYKISASLSEFNVFKNDLQELLHFLPENVYNICAYGFTEIFNNSIDHSHGTKISLKTSYQNKMLSISISDNGVGIFKNICDYFKLNDIRESVIQLIKGKMTTDPIKHTGEGIFFSSKAFDTFEMYANKLYFLRDNRENDWSISTCQEKMTGTTVIMSIQETATRNIIEIFKKYQDEESLAFDRTEITVKLARIGEEILMSRSQAKRITLGLEKFKYVTLDFSGIKLIGQGFVDEIFRVYQRSHKDITFHYINANDDVEFMIKRSLANL